MQENIYFSQNLLKLLKLYRCCGFAHFSYNPSTGKFEHSRALYRVSRVILRTTQVVSGLWILFMSATAVVFFLQHRQKAKQCHSFDVIVTFCQMYWRFLCSHLLSTGYLRHGHRFIPALNEMLKVYRRIRRFTGKGVYFTSRFQILYSVKIVLSLIRMYLEVIAAFASLATGDISTLFGVVLMELTIWSHLYANLTLTCFISKVNTFLESTSVSTSRRYIARLVAVYFRIHRLKRVTRQFFSVLLLCTFFGFVKDIGYVCDMLQQLLKTPIRGKTFRTPQVLLYESAVGFLTSYDIYLMAYVGEMLADADGELRTRLLLLTNGWWASDAVSQSVDLVLVRHPVSDLSTRMLETYVFERKLFFFYVREIIFANVINCIQISMTKERRCTVQRGD